MLMFVQTKATSVYKAKMPAPVAQLFGAVCEDDSIVPFNSVVKDITGRHNSYEEYLKESKV